MPTEAEIEAAQDAVEDAAHKWRIVQSGQSWLVYEVFGVDEVVPADQAVLFRFGNEKQAKFFKRGKTLSAALTAAERVRALVAEKQTKETTGC